MAADVAAVDVSFDVLLLQEADAGYVKKSALFETQAKRN